MINFTNVISHLAVDVKNMLEQIGYEPHMYQSMQKSGNFKYTVRLSKDVKKFMDEMSLSKT